MLRLERIPNQRSITIHADASRCFSGTGSEKNGATCGVDRAGTPGL